MRAKPLCALLLVLMMLLVPAGGALGAGEGEDLFELPDDWTLIQSDSGLLPPMEMVLFTSYLPATGYTKDSRPSNIVRLLQVIVFEEEPDQARAEEIAESVLLRDAIGREFVPLEVRLSFNEMYGFPQIDFLYFLDVDYGKDVWKVRCEDCLYSLVNVPDVPEAESLTATPEPTPAPTPTPVPGEKGEVIRLLAEARDDRIPRKPSDGPEGLEAVKGRLVIAIFNPSGELAEYSPEAEGDFHGFPRELLADSLETGDRLILIYRTSKAIGYYTSGGQALRAYTRVAIIDLTDGRSFGRYVEVVNDPPQTIRGGPGAGAAGAYEPEKALASIRVRLGLEEPEVTPVP